MLFFFYTFSWFGWCKWFLILHSWFWVVDFSFESVRCRVGWFHAFLQLLMVFLLVLIHFDLNLSLKLSQLFQLSLQAIIGIRRGTRGRWRRTDGNLLWIGSLHSLWLFPLFFSFLSLWYFCFWSLRFILTRQRGLWLMPWQFSRFALRFLLSLLRPTIMLGRPSYRPRQLLYLNIMIVFLFLMIIFVLNEYFVAAWWALIFH